MGRGICEGTIGGDISPFACPNLDRDQGNEDLVRENDSWDSAWFKSSLGWKFLLESLGLSFQSLISVETISYLRFSYMNEKIAEYILFALL